jgi:hypothetical protein
MQINRHDPAIGAEQIADKRFVGSKGKAADENRYHIQLQAI